MTLSTVRRACALVALTIALFAPSLAAAQTPRARATVLADSILIGQRARLAIVTESRADAQPVFPPNGAFVTLGDLEIVGDPEIAEPQMLGGGMRRDSAVYDVTTFALDTARVASLALAFVVDEDTVRAVTRASAVRVASVLPDSGATLMDLNEVADFPRPWWFWALWLLAIAAVLGGLYLWWRKRQGGDSIRTNRAQPRAAPYEEAVQRFAALGSIDLEDSEAVKPYYVELSDALRTYLERRAGVSALEMTSAELLRALRQRAVSGVGREEVAAVERVLSVSDYAKFADGRPPAGKGRDALREARTVVDAVEAAHTRAEASPEPA